MPVPAFIAVIVRTCEAGNTDEKSLMPSRVMTLIHLTLLDRPSLRRLFTERQRDPSRVR